MTYIIAHLNRYSDTDAGTKLVAEITSTNPRDSVFAKSQVYRLNP